MVIFLSPMCSFWSFFKVFSIFISCFAWSAVSSTKSGFLCNSKFHISRSKMSSAGWWVGEISEQTWIIISSWVNFQGSVDIFKHLLWNNSENKYSPVFTEWLEGLLFFFEWHMLSIQTTEKKGQDKTPRSLFDTFCRPRCLIWWRCIFLYFFTKAKRNVWNNKTILNPNHPEQQNSWTFFRQPTKTTPTLWLFPIPPSSHCRCKRQVSGVTVIDFPHLWFFATLQREGVGADEWKFWIRDSNESKNLGFFGAGRG